MTHQKLRLLPLLCLLAALPASADRGYRASDDKMQLEPAVQALLDRRSDLTRVSLADVLGDRAAELGGDVLRVAPHTHGMDGFFGVILGKKAKTRVV